MEAEFGDIGWWLDTASHDGGPDCRAGVEESPAAPRHCSPAGAPGCGSCTASEEGMTGARELRTPRRRGRRDAHPRRRGRRRAAGAAAARLPAEPRDVAPGRPGAGRAAHGRRSPTCVGTATRPDRRRRADHASYSKRAMAADQVGAHARGSASRRFALVGHDRGARVAHRLCLDHPEAVTRVALLDIVPTRHVFTHVDRALAQAYYHWFFLAQPADLPERLIGADPELLGAPQARAVVGRRTASTPSRPRRSRSTSAASATPT